MPDGERHGRRTAAVENHRRPHRQFLGSEKVRRQAGRDLVRHGFGVPAAGFEGRQPDPPLAGDKGLAGFRHFRLVPGTQRFVPRHGVADSLPDLIDPEPLRQCAEDLSGDGETVVADIGAEISQ